ncbi:MAG: sugar phosphate isomerase/epimerase [Lentisphaerae bacterium]|nr:sugar phosphate isomerase/epimerase [Lentisphaerota bacterium]
MKKGIVYVCLPEGDPQARFGLAAEMGFDSVEVPTLRTDDERERFRKAARDAGVAVSSVMNIDHWSHPFSDPDPAVRAASLAGVQQSLDTAAALGGDTVLLVPAVVTPAVTYEQAWERSREAIGSILPQAEKLKVKLAVENVWNRFLLSPIEFAAYVDSFKSPWMTAYFDVGNIVAYGFPQHWIRTLGRRLDKVHIKGFDGPKHAWTQLLAGSIDWPAVMAALREVGYDGAVTAELKGPGDDPRAAVQAISADMDRIFAIG